jgi:hypothetical protein
MPLFLQIVIDEEMRMFDQPFPIMVLFLDDLRQGQAQDRHGFANSSSKSGLKIPRRASTSSRMRGLSICWGGPYTFSPFP